MHSKRVIPAAFIAVILLLATISAASAHEHREIGEYELTVGFRTEPALVDEPNGLDLRVQRGHGDGGTPVEGLQETLQAEISYGGETMPLELRGVFNAPGSYTADLIPTATGTYSFRIFGTIEGMEIDETFTGGPDTFSEVVGKSQISFPAGTTDASGGATAAEAKDAADTAQTIAIIGLIAGLLGLAAGIGAFMVARNSRTAAASAPGTVARPVEE
jgi:hypothetical protein